MWHANHQGNQDLQCIEWHHELRPYELYEPYNLLKLRHQRH
jgi:hypothetical protein